MSFLRKVVLKLVFHIPHGYTNITRINRALNDINPRK